MEEWIRVGALLLREPVIHRLADLLANRARSAHERVPTRQALLATCVGAVVIVWITFAALADENDEISGDLPDVDQLTGIQGLGDLLTRERLVILDTDHAKLSGFWAHTSHIATRRQLKTERQRRWRKGVSERKNGRLL